MTHEETLTFHVAREIRSYRDLPQILYHFQTKERDEPRPRAGVLRTREFIMKDAYTFDRDREGLDAPYELHVEAYDRIFDRCGLEWYRVESDVGMMGGIGAHEYMAPCAAGENDVALSDARLRGQRRGRERDARSRSRGCRRRSTRPSRSRPRAPRRSSRSRACWACPPGALIKALPVIVEGRGARARGACAATTGSTRSSSRTRSARRPGRRPRTRCGEPFGAVAGFIGPVGRARRGDRRRGAARPARASSRARNEPDMPPPRRRARPRLRARPGPTSAASRRATPTRAAPRSASSRRSRSATSSSSARATRSRSAPPTSTRTATSSSIWMGSYGIGPARILAAAIEQFADEQGISWPRAIAPFDVELVDARQAGRGGPRGRRPALRGAARRRASTCSTTTATASAGEKFADAELLGCPLRLTVGKRGIEAGEVEAQIRRGQEKRSLPLDGAAAGGGGAVARSSPDRSAGCSGSTARAPPPPETLARPAAQPVDDPERDRLRAARAAAGVPRARASTPDDGRVAPRRDRLRGRSRGSDYLDGMAARITGQYSRLGALLDPLTDRALVLSGVDRRAGTSSCCRAGRSPCSRRASCSCSC